MPPHFFWMDECMRKLHALHIFFHIVIDKFAERMGKIPSDSYFAVLQYFFFLVIMVNESYTIKVVDGPRFYPPS